MYKYGDQAKHPIIMEVLINYTGKWVLKIMLTRDYILRI